MILKTSLDLYYLRINSSTRKLTSALVCGYNIPPLIVTAFCGCRPETFSSRSLICCSRSWICLSFSSSCHCSVISVVKNWYTNNFNHTNKNYAHAMLSICCLIGIIFSPISIIPSAIFINSGATLWITCLWCIMQPLPSIILKSSSHPYNFMSHSYDSASQVHNTFFDPHNFFCHPYPDANEQMSIWFVAITYLCWSLLSFVVGMKPFLQIHQSVFPDPEFASSFLSVAFAAPVL